MTDAREPRWHPNVYKLAASITDAYLGATGASTVYPAERADLWQALVSRVAELLTTGHIHADVGARVGDTIEEWERRHQVDPGPRRFRVSSPDEVVVET